jgi:hypothetical protein
MALLSSFKHLNTIDLLHLHFNRIPPYQTIQNSDAVWIGSEHPTILEGSNRVKYTESIFAKTAREVFRTIAAKNAEIEAKKTKKGRSGTSKKLGANEVPIEKKEEKELEKPRLRIRHRRITSYQVNLRQTSLIEERYEELSL